MGKHEKVRKSVNNHVGKGNVTPLQVALIVDRYLSLHNFSQTLVAFRSEASSLTSSSSLLQSPKSLLSLGELLDEYTLLKEHKAFIQQEQCVLAQEWCKMQTLLQGLHDLANAYPSSVTPHFLNSSSTGDPAYTTPSVSMAQNVKMDHSNLSTPINCSYLPGKRKNYKDLQNVPQAPKKNCGLITTNDTFSNKGNYEAARQTNASKDHIIIHQSPLPTLSPNYAQGGSSVHGSSVTKNLFNMPSSSASSEI